MSGVTMEKIVALSKSRGFVFPGSEIYGGFANTWDYGPLGVELLNNVKKAWWKKFIQESPHNVGLDSAILMNPVVWEASGHVAGFNDPMMDCRDCKARHRADKIIEDHMKDTGVDDTADGWSYEKMKEYIDQHKITCPKCGKRDFTDIRKFELMFKTFVGVTEDKQSTVYLRPETAQGIFVNFKNVQRTARKKIPFGIGQVGKSFRNEITPGNFVFRTLEFEQLELEFFCEPGTDMEWFEYWRSFCMKWLVDLGLPEDSLRFSDHKPEQLSHYSVATTDIQVKFPFGWDELWGIANRTDYDLKQHQQYSGEDMSYFDQAEKPEDSKRYVPYCVEPSVGVGRLALTFLLLAYDEETLTDEKGKEDVRTVLRLHPALAPIKAAVLPLSKKLGEHCDELYAMLSKHFMCTYDDSGAIGRRYRRQDEIGTPYCITFDFDSLEDKAVTVRDRDSMEQERVKIEELVGYLNKKLEY